MLPGEVAGVGFGEDAEFDQALQLGPGAFDVLRQRFTAEEPADVLGSQGAGRLVEGGEDARVVRVVGQLGRGCGEPVSEAGDGLAGDREESRCVSASRSRVCRSDVAALISAFAAVVGLLLGFFGLPTVIDSPTARTVTATATATVTVTAPAPIPSGSDGEASATPSSLAPLPPGTVPLTGLSPVRGSGSFNLQSVTMGSKPYEQAMAFNPCDAGPLEYSINERYQSLTLTIGLDDNSTAKLITVTIEGDDHVLKTVSTEINRPQDVTVDMTGVVKLEIDFTTNDDCLLRNNILLALRMSSGPTPTSWSSGAPLRSEGRSC
ncbi:hypothetical protein [Streptomyces sp. NPDC096132]|uniref:hypothetical protein n=1 Tax=Streptomyces sp. NPDC096132 TaxID=3366075 RepID=UPI0037FB6D34